jgi:putative endonuclease
MYFTYILFSESLDRYYIGATEDPQERIKKHNSKNKGFTNRAKDWEFVYLNSFESKKEAFEHEKQIKSWKSRAKIKKLIEDNPISEHPDA